MRRSTLTEKQRAFATLAGLGQYQHKQIAQMLNIHRNSVRNWLKDERIQSLVSEVQERVQQKLESLAIASTVRDNSPLMQKATEKLHEMLDGRSTRTRMQAIRFLLNGSMSYQEKHQNMQESYSPLRLDPLLTVKAKVQES